MAEPYEQGMAEVILDILDDVILKLRGAVAPARPFLGSLDQTHIDRGLPPIKNMKKPPSVYVELESTEQAEWHTTNAITLHCIFSITVIVSNTKNYKTSQTALVNLVGDIFDTLANLDSTELGGAARLTVSPNVEYGGFGTGSAYRRVAIMTFSADKAFIVDTG